MLVTELHTTASQQQPLEDSQHAGVNVTVSLRTAPTAMRLSSIGRSALINRTLFN